VAVVISDLVHQPRSVACVVLPAAGVPSPDACLEDDFCGSSVCGSPAPSPLVVVSSAHEISPALDLLSSTAIPAGSPPSLLRVQTHLLNNIVKPKKLFAEMDRYANFCATEEPQSVSKALHDPCWKCAMED
jgi:hypothetical protein